MSGAISTQALVLRRVNHGEADRVITLLTKDAGRVSVYAKGVRKPKSKLSSGLELCMVSDVSFIPSSRAGGLGTVTSVRMNEYFEELVKEYEGLQLAFALLKIVDKASEYEEDTSTLYELSVGLLKGLNNSTITQDTVTLWFLMRLTSLLGQGIHLHKPIDTSEAFSNNAVYCFDNEKMGFARNDSGTIMPSDIKLLKLIMLSDSPLRLRTIVNIDASVARLKGIREYLSHNLQAI